MNSISILFLKIPEIINSYYYIKFNFILDEKNPGESFNFFCWISLYDCDKLSGDSDFLFNLNGLFQFLIFYFCNSKFRKNFRNLFGIKHEKPKKEVLKRIIIF